MTKVKNILLIIIFSSLLGLIVNYINPAGIKLIREEIQIKWADDSLLIDNVEQINTDSLKISDAEEVKIPETNKSNITQNQENKNSKELINQKEKTSNSETIEKNINSDNISYNEPIAIHLEQAFKLYSRGVTFIDAREEFDFKEGHVHNAINIPYYDFEDHQSKLNNLKKEEAIVTYCEGTDCDLSILLGNKLFEMGYKKVFIFFGGWLDWIKAEYPIDRVGANE